MAVTGPETRTRLLLGLADNERELDEQDYLEAEFQEPWRYELVRGRLSVMSPNSEAHDDAADPWRDQFYAYRRGNPGIIQKIVPEAWVRIGPEDYRIGDLGVYLLGGRSAQKRPARVPELMIEILSLGRDARDRDLVEKRDEYHAIGVLEYIIVDRWGERVYSLTHEPDGYAERILSGTDTYETPLLPGFTLRLSEVF